MRILKAEAMPLFIGTEEEPKQVVQVTLRGDDRAGAPQATVSVRAAQATSEPLALGGLAAGELATLELGVTVDPALATGTVLPAEVLVEQGATLLRHPFDLVVAEPGWRMFMISHFHYDPVWWNTQAAYTETWGNSWMFRNAFQEPGLALVKAHLDMCRRDPPPFERAVAAGPYAPPLREAIHALKFRGVAELAPLLGGLAASAFGEQGTAGGLVRAGARAEIQDLSGGTAPARFGTYVIPVPAHPRRTAARSS